MHPRPPSGPPKRVALINEVIEKVQQDYASLMRENELLKKKLQQKELDVLELQKQQIATKQLNSTASVLPTQPAPAPLEPRRGALPRPPQLQIQRSGPPPGTVEGFTTALVPRKLDGSSSLWRIPFNGKSSAEKRIVAVAVASEARGRGKLKPLKFVDALFTTLETTSEFPPQGEELFLKLPISLRWYPEDNTSEAAVRELVLTQDAHLSLGHATRAFQKTISRGGPLPRAELCFSVVTATRSLDLAAETRQEAEAWITALQSLLSLAQVLTPSPSPLPPGTPPSPMAAARALQGGGVPFHLMPPPASPKAAVCLQQGGGGYPVPVLSVSSPPASPAAATTTPPHSSLQARRMRPTTLSVSPTAAPLSHQRAVPPSPTSPTFSGFSRLGSALTLTSLPWHQRLVAAAHSGDVDQLEEVLRGGAPVDAELDAASHETALMLAARMGYANVVRLCLQYGAKNDPHPDHGMTALHAAAAGGQMDTAAVLLQMAAKAKADAIICNLTDLQGRSPLHVATARGDALLAEMLLVHGADPHRPDAEGNTSVHVAAGAGSIPLLTLLLVDFDGDVVLDQLNRAGLAPLHLSILGGHAKSVRLLLESAANPFVLTGDGRSPLDLCVSKALGAIGVLIVEYQKGSGRDKPDSPPLSPRVEVEEEKEEEKGNKQQESGDAEKEEKEKKEEEEAPLPSEQFQVGGEQWGAYCTSDGLWYFGHLASGHTQWDDPRDLLPAEDVDEDEEGRNVGGESEEEDEDEEVEVEDKEGEEKVQDAARPRPSMWTRSDYEEDEEDEEDEDKEDEHEVEERKEKEEEKAGAGAEAEAEAQAEAEVAAEAAPSPPSLELLLSSHPALSKYAQMRSRHGMPLQHVVNMMRLAAVAEKDIALLSGLLMRRDAEAIEEGSTVAADL